MQASSSNSSLAKAESLDRVQTRFGTCETPPLFASAGSNLHARDAFGFRDAPDRPCQSELRFNTGTPADPGFASCLDLQLVNADSLCRVSLALVSLRRDTEGQSQE